MIVLSKYGTSTELSWDDEGLIAYITRRLPGIRSSIDKFGFTAIDASEDESVTEQQGVFRTNCLDWYGSVEECRAPLTPSFLSLDRTNFVQDILSKTALEVYFLHIRPEWRQSMNIWTSHREIWAENGDALSKIYAGTGALNTSVTRTGKRTFGGEERWILLD